MTVVIHSSGKTTPFDDTKANPTLVTDCDLGGGKTSDFSRQSRAASHHRKCGCSIFCCTRFTLTKTGLVYRIRNDTLNCRIPVQGEKQDCLDGSFQASMRPLHLGRARISQPVTSRRTAWGKYRGINTHWLITARLSRKLLD